MGGKSASSKKAEAAEPNFGGTMMDDELGCVVG